MQNITGVQRQMFCGNNEQGFVPNNNIIYYVPYSSHYIVYDY